MEATQKAFREQWGLIVSFFDSTQHLATNTANAIDTNLVSHQFLPSSSILGESPRPGRALTGVVDRRWLQRTSDVIRFVVPGTPTGTPAVITIRSPIFAKPDLSAISLALASSSSALDTDSIKKG